MLDRWENRLGRYAIPGLIRYVVLFNALVYVLQLVSPGYTIMLALQPEMVWQGEIWRIFTWVFLPRTISPVWIFFALLFLWFLGDMLESAWGSFRVNLFYLTGWFCTTLAVLIFPGAGLGPGANVFLNLTILFAVATLQPNYQIMLFFVLPVKLKWVAAFSAIYPLLLFVTIGLGGKIAILISLANYLLFFGPAFLRQRAESARNASRLAKFREAQAVDETMHRCVTCGRTEESHPDLEFRVSGDGEEYCLDHLPKNKTLDTP